jgi:uncharacterized phage infection (PIP) family protein YhgE
MPGIADQVAAVEVEAASAASTAQAAQESAEAAAQAAALLTAQVTANAAAEITEATEAIAETERETEWLKTQVTELQAGMQSLRESQTAMASALEEIRAGLATMTASPSPTPAPAPSSGDAVDPDSATTKKPDGPPSADVENQPPAESRKKRHRML